MLNHIVVMGRLTRDPELRRTASGIAVANFSIAVERDFPSQDGSRETDFIDCVAWKHTAEFVGKYFSKGKQIAVKGRLQIRSWTDKDGNKRRTAEIVADNVYFAGAKTESPAGVKRYETPVAYGAQSPIDPVQEDYPLLTDDDPGLPY